MNVTFSFTLDTKYIKHLKEESSYNHNYYELEVSPYGDYILPEQCNILYQECEDDNFEAYYSLGYFDASGKFKAMWTWLDRWDKLNEVGDKT